jgi:hypothetical protein
MRCTRLTLVVVEQQPQKYIRVNGGAYFMPSALSRARRIWLCVRRRTGLSAHTARRSSRLYRFGLIMSTPFRSSQISSVPAPIPKRLLTVAGKRSFSHPARLDWRAGESCASMAPSPSASVTINRASFVWHRRAEFVTCSIRLTALCGCDSDRPPKPPKRHDAALPPDRPTYAPTS